MKKARKKRKNFLPKKSIKLTLAKMTPSTVKLHENLYDDKSKSAQLIRNMKSFKKKLTSNKFSKLKKISKHRKLQKSFLEQDIFQHMFIQLNSMIQNMG